ncbi:MAG TPA: hypothetical protein VF384_03195 [Planctomycetota bacterium]
MTPPSDARSSLLLAACLAACVGAIPATAQSTIVIPNGTAAVEGDDFNNFPWGRGGTGLLHQCIYDPVNFTAQGVTTPIVITRLRWRPDDMRSSVASAYAVGGSIRLSTCPLASTAATQVFANQRGPDYTTVWSGPVSWPAFAATPGPCPFHFDFPLTTPFTYNPAAGALNIEVDLPIQGFSGTTPLQLDVMTFGSNASRVWLSSGYVNGGPNATTPFPVWSPHGLVVEVTYAPPSQFAAADPYGHGCYDIPHSVYELFDSAPFDLSGSGMSMLVNGPDGYVCVPAQTTWIAPGGAAQTLTLADDNEVTVPLNSPLPHPGGTTNSLSVCSNGFVSTGPNGGPSNDPTIAGFLGFTHTTWAADWHDYNPMGLGSGTVKYEQIGTLSCVTWDGVFSFAGQSPNTFQIQFDRATGNVHVHWVDIQDLSDHMVGFKIGGPALDPGNRDISASLANFFLCGPDERALRLAASARPITGTSISLNTTHTGAGLLGANILSLTLFNPGVELSAIGMPNCLVSVNLDVLSVHLPSGGAFSTLFAVPNVPALSGLHVGSQSAIFGDTLANLAGMRSSNALDLRIGTQ